MQKVRCYFDYSNYSMKSQILAIAFCITLLIFGLSFGIISLANQLAFEQFQASSEQIYYQASSNQMKSQLYQYKRLISKVLEINGNQLVTLHRLYIETLELVKSYDEIHLNYRMDMNYSGTNPIPNGLRSPNGYGNFDTSYCFLCYSNLTVLPRPLTKNQLIGIKVQEYLQAFGQIIYQESLTKQSFDYGFTLSDRIFSVYPCLNRRETVFKYIPEKRQWYIDALKIYNQSEIFDYNYQLTSLYVLYTEKIIGLSMVLPMIDQHKQFIGAWSTNIYGSEFSKYIQQQDEEISMLLLVDNQGSIIVHNYTISFDQMPAYIYTENITGFNQDDWNQIKSLNGQSNCFNSEYDSTRICRYNSLYKQNLLIQVIKMEQYQIYLIMFHSSSKYFEFQKSFNDRITHFFSDFLMSFLIQMLITYLGLAIVISFVILSILYPLNWVIQRSKIKINTQYAIPQQYKTWMDIFESQTLQNFKIRFLSIYQKRGNGSKFCKSSECDYFERLKYPKRVFRTNSIFKPSIAYLQNNDNHVQQIRKNTNPLMSPTTTAINRNRSISTIISEKLLLTESIG